MKKIYAALWVAFAAFVFTCPADAFLRGGYAPPAAPSFTGLVDSFPGATLMVSAFKPTNAYTGNWGTVERQSDGTTQVISYLSTGEADNATFTSFCSGTVCFARVINDSISANSATQTTRANQARVILNGNGHMALCPQPGTKYQFAFSSGVNTASQHIFFVVKAGTADNNWSQPDVATIPITANVTSSSASISSMSSQAGISVPTAPAAWVTATGVKDSANRLPNSGVTTTNATNLSALPTGTTGTLNYTPAGTASGSTTGDTLTFTPGVIGGVWINNGPTTTNFGTGAYWGFGLGAPTTPLGSNNNYPTDFVTPQTSVSGANAIWQYMMGQGMRSVWSVVDYSTNGQQVNYDAASLGTNPNTTPTTITFSTNVGDNLFSDANGNNAPVGSCFETVVKYGSTQASRVAMSGFLQTQSGFAGFPFAPATSDGFTWTGIYQPGPVNTSSYGVGVSTTDIFGIQLFPETGGYTYPSLSVASNINNSTTMYRTVVHQGDSDTIDNQNERSEFGAYNNQVLPGASFSWAYYLRWDQYTSQTGSWCYGGQLHTEGGSIADLITYSCKNGTMQFVTQTASADVNCGSPVTITIGTIYAVIITGKWSNGAGTDTLTINAGPIGTTPIPQLCNQSGNLWPPGASAGGGAYMKIGTYRGDPWNNPGTLDLRTMNVQWNGTTANAFASQITSPMSLPTHP